MSWSLVVAAALALLLGGDFRRLADVRIRLWWVLVAALLFKIGLLVGHAPPSSWAQAVIFALVAVGMLANWRLPGVVLVAAGLLANTLVVALNGGMMPFSTAAYVAAGKPLDAATNQPKTSALAQPEQAGSHVVWLDDRIPFAPTKQLISVGDIAIMLGGAWLILGLTRPTRLRLSLAPGT